MAVEDPKAAAAKRADKRKKQKERKKHLVEKETRLATNRIIALNKKQPEEDEEVEYVRPDDVQNSRNVHFETFKKVFDAFSTPEQLTTALQAQKEEAAAEAEALATGKPVKSASSDLTATDEKKTLSKRERKLKSRLSIAVLKQLVPRPEVVEVHDCNSHDPRLLVYLKSYRNTVAVPGHWCQKRKYLQNKRGIDKLPFELPKFIEDTGIAAMRGQQTAAEEGKSVRNKARARMQPKTGKIDIDYQTLHDAFFRYQTKPDKMTYHSELYYEGKEYEVAMRVNRPGHLSHELRRALGIGDNAPAPWLGAMQRYGPPPAYPKLKIPGVNCPIPPGGQWGFNDGEWGKPPVDQFGRPLYGDVFGTEAKAEFDQEEVNKSLWADIESEDEEEEDDEVEDGIANEDADEDEDEDEDMESGITSVTSGISGLETPEKLELRKKDGTGTETPEEVRGTHKTLYTELKEKAVSVGSGLFGTDKTYEVPVDATDRQLAAAKASRRGEVEVALNPDELASLDAATLKRKYETQLEIAKAAVAANREDVSDVIAEHAKKKRKTKDSDKKI